ncbi:MAG: hypothetical protein B7Z73_13885, partial [Planctomycetia bacterium 21-64-5]
MVGRPHHQQSRPGRPRAKQERRVLRYEDLHHDPVAPFTRVVETLEGCVDQARLARAIAASSFGALRRLEDRGIFPETSGLARSG